MSERIDVRGDIKIAGASGDAVRGEVPALTRWVPAGQAVRSPAGAVGHRASGCPVEFAAGDRDPREPRRGLRPGRPGSAAMTAAHRARECYTRCAPRLARLRLLAGDGVVAAAADGSAAALPRPLRKFEALTTALWTVQSELRPAWPAPARAPGRTGSRMRTPDRGPAASRS